MSDNGQGIAVGDVVQINEQHEHKGWVGAFVLVEEVKSWGIQGFVHHITTHEEMAHVYIRLKWSEIDRIGRALLLPRDLLETPPREEPTA